MELSILLLPLFFYLCTSLGELPESGDVIEDGDSLETSETALILNSGSGVVGGSEDVDGPTPPSVVAAPLDPLPDMSIPVARPPGFRPPTSFVSKKDSGEQSEHVNVGFVVRRGRAKVMGFSRRKSESSD